MRAGGLPRVEQRRRTPRGVRRGCTTWHSIRSPERERGRERCISIERDREREREREREVERERERERARESKTEAETESESETETETEKLAPRHGYTGCRRGNRVYTPSLLHQQRGTRDFVEPYWVMVRVQKLGLISRRLDSVHGDMRGS